MPFYNTTSPTPTTLNSINSVSINIRDFLLNNNISSTYPQISTAINGSPRVGQPVLDTESSHLNFFPHQQMTQDTSTLDILGSVLNGQGVGIGAGGSVVPNFDVRSSLAGRVLGATGLLNDTKIGTIGAQQLALALANNAAFNVEQQLLGSLNLQDNIISLIKDGKLSKFPRPSYQITVPSSTGGKVADFAGKILGFTIPHSYLGDDGSIFQDESGVDVDNITRANAMIKYTGKGQIMALIENAGNNLKVNSTQTKFRSGYAPGFTNSKGEVQLTKPKLYAYTDKEGKFIHLLANLSDDTIPSLSYNKEEKVSVSGFESPDEIDSTPGFVGYKLSYNERQVNDVNFTWATSEDGNVNSRAFYTPINGDKKSLLVKTQKLFNSVGMQNIVTVKGDMDKSSTQISQANGGGFSKGNAVMKSTSFNEFNRYDGSKKSADETYCRSWTTLDRYEKVYNLVRHSGLTETAKMLPYRLQTEGSVLERNGFVKIVPYKDEQPEDPKKFMFSIENLAWNDRVNELPQGEVGPGDGVNNKRGRIMWFPPYDIAFTENSSVNWESTNFIGRGEPVYTYNNTERSGTLTFKIIVDHPSYANAFRDPDGPDDHYINSFWAGCVSPLLKDRLEVFNKTITVPDDQIIPTQKVIPEEVAPKAKMVVYFPNDNITLPDVAIGSNSKHYEDGLDKNNQIIDRTTNSYGTNDGVGIYPGKFTKGKHLKEGWFDGTNYGLNAVNPDAINLDVKETAKFGWLDNDIYCAKINTYLKEFCPHCVVDVTGFASQQGTTPSNNKLISGRAEAIINVLKTKLFTWLPENERASKFTAKAGAIPENPSCRVGNQDEIDKSSCKLDRRAEVTFRFDKGLAGKDIEQPAPTIKKQNKRTVTKTINNFYNETLYFDRLKQDDPLVFDTFREKIKYFHPAFHSTTPEGLNSRLNFLLQCTRQGPTLEKQGANNLAFGRPPICILRIGDFYNTKIVMDSVGIDYEPLVWDLNPEGIGVQPMIANVNISFKFLGGSTLMGPLNKLQNALSFNYFANTQVYDPRADYIAKNNDNIGKLHKEGQKNVNLSVYSTIIDGRVGNMDPMPDVTTTIIPVQDIDQIKVNDANNSGIQPAPVAVTVPTGTIDDKAVINLISLVGFKTYYFENSSLELVFSWSPSSTIKKLNMDATLAKTYKGQVYVKDATNTMTNLGYVSIRSNGLDNGVVFTASSGEENILSPDVTGKLEWGSYLNLNKTQNDAVADAIKKPNSNISIEWETTFPKNNIGFSESFGL